MEIGKKRGRVGSGMLGVVLGAALALGAPPAAAQGQGVKLGIVTFLSGPAAGPFGIPSRNAAELVTEAIN
jgi:branched-chain amino acid transport system substrate-binding protein